MSRTLENIKIEIFEENKSVEEKIQCFGEEKSESAIEHERALNKDFTIEDLKFFLLPPFQYLYLAFLKYPKNVV